MVLNSDCVIASESAAFGLPEVTRGVAAIAGALPRLMRTVGRQRASEMALLGRTYAAQQLCDWGIVNKVVSEESVLGEAMRWASEVANNSPDAIIFSRAGLLRGWDGEDPTYSAHKLNASMLKTLDGGYNMKEGLLSFIEKRKPSWVDSRL